METFEEFGKTLMSILEKTGINAGEPGVTPVHHIVD